MERGGELVYEVSPFSFLNFSLPVRLSYLLFLYVILIIVELGMQANYVPLDVTLMTRDEITRRQRTAKMR